MEAGKLDRRLVLMQPTTTTDAMNEKVRSFADLATVWASKKDVSDAERVNNLQVDATITTRFQIRYSDTAKAVTPTWRVRTDGKTYEVVAVKEIGRREGIEISATARAESALA